MLKSRMLSLDEIGATEKLRDSFGMSRIGFLNYYILGIRLNIIDDSYIPS